MKKIILLITVSILLGLNALLVPLSKVSAVEVNDLTPEEAYTVGAIVTASQGGEVQNNDNFFQKMNDLGNNIVDNAIQNGKRMTDIIVRNGNRILFNPTAIRENIYNAFDDFADFEVSWRNENAVYISLGYSPDREIIFSEYANFTPDSIVFYPSLTGFNTNTSRTQYGSFGQIDSSMERINSSKSVIPYGENRSLGYHSEYSIGVWITNTPTSGYFSHAYIFRDSFATEQYTHIPYTEPPTQDEFISNFSSTFKESYDTETNEVINPNLYYSYDVTEVNNATTVINNEYVTNNYYEITEINNEGDTIIHEPDEEGGGTFWGSLLDLLGQLIKSFSDVAVALAGLASDIVSGISDMILGLFVPEDLDLSGRFDGIQSKFEMKFSGIFDMTGSFTSIYSEPAHLNDIEIELMGEQITIFNTDMMKYLNILRGIITGYIALLTVTNVYKRFTGSGDVIE